MGEAGFPVVWRILCRVVCQGIHVESGCFLQVRNFIGEGMARMTFNIDVHDWSVVRLGIIIIIYKIDVNLSCVVSWKYYN